MPTHIAFLRAINLGAKRRFGKADVLAVTSSAGFTDVQVYLNTGNVRGDSPLRSHAKVAAVLEQAYLLDRGFEVPTYVFSPTQVRAIAERVESLWAEYGAPGYHAVTLYRAPPTTDAVAAAEALDIEGERVVVDGRAAHVLLREGFHGARILNTAEFKALGEGTARSSKVIATLADRWG